VETATAATDIRGRLAIVTGAARGIGFGIASRLAADGARVIATDRDFPALERAFAGADVALLELDVTDDPDALCARVLDGFGAPELIVNNVGIMTPQRYLDVRPEDFDRVLAANLRGPWFLTRGLVDALIQRKARGNVLFVSSLHDHQLRTYPHYSASKAAVAMLVRELAMELAPHGIRVNAVSPGWVVEPGTRFDKHTRRLIPLDRPGAPDDVATIATVLLSDRLTSYVTGANVPVDGGLDLHSWLTH
jgi:NAD(P)-dependent dehydrogenase (short-subunit alcohol dehydrogenase family)